MKKVLIITYYWPPSGGAGVQRWLKFVKYLPEFGWEPHVYTPENPEAPSIDTSLLKDVNKEAVIIKREIWEPYTFYKKFTGKKGSVNAGFLAEEKTKSSLMEKISVWIRGNLFIPDARRFWIRPSVKFLYDYIRKNNIDVLITTGPPHSMHLIGMELKRLTNIKWVADFRDPWTNIDFYKDLMLTRLADKYHHKLERRVFEEADEIISIGKTMANEFSSTYKRDVKIITNGYDEGDFESFSREMPGYGKFTITHVGSINKDRHHLVFWQAIRDLIDSNAGFADDIRLIFVGKNDHVMTKDLLDLGLDNLVEIIPYVNHDEVPKYLFKGNLLYLPLNNTPNAKGVLTGKLFEYLSTGRQILSIGPVDGDVANILDDIGAGHTVQFDDYEACKKNIINNYQNFKNAINVEYSGSVEKFSRRNLTKKLVELL